MAALEYAQSLLVPVKAKQGLRYRLVFYPTYTEKGKPSSEAIALPAQVVVEFDMTTSSVSCTRPRGLPGKLGETLGRAVPSVATQISYDAYGVEEDRLYTLVEKVGAAFVAGKSDAATRKVAAEFRALFDRFSEPGLVSTYRALSPDFWKWLDGLDAPKKPSQPSKSGG
jgi:hypothetical protein